MVLDKERIEELDAFVKRNDITHDFDDIVSVQECYNADVRDLIETVRAKDLAIESLVRLITGEK